MKAKLISMGLAIAVFFSCGSFGFDTKIEYSNDRCLNYNPKRRLLLFTNTSKSKYLEVTIRYDDNGHVSTSVIKLRPGEIEEECKYWKSKVSIVGEREITGNE